MPVSFIDGADEDGDRQRFNLLAKRPSQIASVAEAEELSNWLTLRIAQIQDQLTAYQEGRTRRSATWSLRAIRALTLIRYQRIRVQQHTLALISVARKRETVLLQAEKAPSFVEAARELLDGPTFSRIDALAKKRRDDAYSVSKQKTAREP